MTVTGYAAVGHGIKPDGVEDPGAVGNGWTEQTAGDFATAKFVDVCRSLGFEMISEAYKRDPNFVGSIEAANRAGVDFVVAFHHDIRTAPRGTFVYHYFDSEGGEELARAYIAEIEALGLPTRDAWLGPGQGFADGPVAPRALSLLKRTRMPAILIEIGPIGHHTLDEQHELEQYGIAAARAVARVSGIDPDPVSKVERAVAVTAVREPDIEYAKMLGIAHAFAFVQKDSDSWVQTYPDGRQVPVDYVEYPIAIGWGARRIVDSHGDGLVIAGEDRNETRELVVEKIQDLDVPRTRPWATR